VVKARGCRFLMGFWVSCLFWVALLVLGFSLFFLLLFFCLASLCILSVY
jgi:hypothetical protein